MDLGAHAVKDADARVLDAGLYHVHAAVHIHAQGLHRVDGAAHRGERP